MAHYWYGVCQKLSGLFQPLLMRVEWFLNHAIHLQESHRDLREVTPVKHLKNSWYRDRLLADSPHTISMRV